MNILLVAYYFPPLNNAGAVRPVQLARWLRHFGHTVHILTHGYDKKTADPDPAVIRIHDPAYARSHQGGRFFQWLFWRGWAELQNYGGKYASIFSPWRRAVLRRSRDIQRISRPDLVLATYPPMEVLEIGLELSRRFHVPLVSDFRDGLLFHSIEEKRLGAHRCLHEKYKKIEKAIAAESAMVVAVTPVLQEYFIRNYPDCHCATVFNGYDENEWRDLPAVELEPGYFNIIHTGRCALSDSATDIAPFLAALRRLAREHAGMPFRLYQVGEVSRRERSQLRDLIDMGVVRLQPLAGRRESLSFQKAADLLLLITRPGVRSGIPLKLFEYIRSGRPVLSLSDDMEVRRITEKSGSGWCASPQDETGIAARLERIFCDPAFMRSLRRDPEMIASYSWPQQMQRLHELLISVGKSIGH